MGKRKANSLEIPRMRNKRIKEGKRTEEIMMKKEKVRVSMQNADGFNELTEYDTLNFIKSQKPEIHGVLESKLRDEDSKKIKVPGYAVVENRRSDLEDDRDGGGIIVFIKKTAGIKMQEKKFKIRKPALQYVQKERTWVTAKTDGEKLAVGFVYVSHQTADDKYGQWNDGVYEVLEDEIKILKQQGFKILLKGDMNAWVGNGEGGIPGNNPAITRNGERLMSFLERRRMIHLNGTDLCTGVFTRHNSRSSSALDFSCVFEEDVKMVKKMFVDEKGIFGGHSDHVFIVTDLEMEYAPTNAPTSKLRKATKWRFEQEVDWIKVGETMDNVLTANEEQTEGDVDKLGDLCARAPVEGLSNVVGRTESVLVKPKEYPAWLRKELVNLKLKTSAWREQRSEATKYPTKANLKELEEKEKKKENQKSKVDEAMSKFWSTSRAEVIGRLEEGGPGAAKLFWKYVVNKDIGATEFTVIEDPVTGELKAGQEDKKEMVEQFLKDLFQGSFEKFPRTVKEGDIEAEDGTEEEEYSEILEKEFSEEEVARAIMKLKNGKAMGIDDVPNEVLKHYTPKFISLLTKLYNLVQKTGKTPEVWKTGRLVLVHKSGSRSDLGNFRPLNVIAAEAGLFSKVLNERLTKVVEERGLLGEIQQGFRKDRRGADNTFVLNTILMKCSAKRKKPHLAYLDIKKV